MVVYNKPNMSFVDDHVIMIGVIIRLILTSAPWSYVEAYLECVALIK